MKQKKPDSNIWDNPPLYHSFGFYLFFEVAVSNQVWVPDPFVFLLYIHLLRHALGFDFDTQIYLLITLQRSGAKTLFH